MAGLSQPLFSQNYYVKPGKPETHAQVYVSPVRLSIPHQTTIANPKVKKAVQNHPFGPAMPLVQHRPH
jgi:hypothetical protein